VEPRDARAAPSPELVEAFARRSAAFGQTLAAMDEVESAQRREWSDALAAAYGELGDAEIAARLRNAQGWLALAPNSAPLLVTLGRLQAQQNNVAAAEESLQRALALAPSASAWEALGDVRRRRRCDRRCRGVCECAARAARRQFSRSNRCRRAAPSIKPIAFEERSEHGVPRLPAH
jgi:HemY protein